MKNTERPQRIDRDAGEFSPLRLALLLLRQSWRLVISVINMPFVYIFGRDIFISYSRQDSREYAPNLTLMVQKRYQDQHKRKLSFYLDRWIAPPSGQLPLSLRLQLRWSSMLVVVCSERAVGSDFVKDEVARYAKLGRKVLTVDVDGAYQAVRGEQPWVSVSGADPETEVAAAVRSGNPSDSVVDRIVKMVEFTIQDRRLRRAVWGTVAFVALSIGGAVVFSLVTVRSAEAKAAAAESREKSANERATSAESKASTAEAKALDEGRKAQQATTAASVANAEASRQEGLARESAAEAERQQQIADDLGKRNIQEQGRKLALGAQIEFRESPNAVLRSVLLATEALGLSPSVEGDDAIRKGLALLPQLLVSQQGDRKTEKVLFAPKGDFLASLDSKHFDGTGGAIRLWSLKDLKSFEPKIIDSGASDFEFSATGDSIGILKSGKASIYQLSSGRFIAGPLSSEASELHFSHQGGLMAVIRLQQDQSSVDVFATSDWHRIHEIVVPGMVTAIAFSENEKLLATGSNDFKARVWNIAENKELNVFDETSLVSAVRFFNESKCLMTFDHDLQVRSLAGDANDLCLLPVGPEELSTIGREIRTVSFSPKGGYLAIRTENGIVIKKWDEPLSGSAPVVIRHPGRGALSFSLDESMIATVGSDRTVRTWNLPNGEERSRIPYDGESTFYEATGFQDPIHSVALSANGETVAVAMQNPTEGAVDGQSHLLRLYKTAGFDGAVVLSKADPESGTAVSFDGRYMASGTEEPDGHYKTEHRVRVLDLRSGTVVASLDIEGSIRSLAFSPNDKYIGIGDDDHVVHVWSWREGARAVKEFHHQGTGTIQDLAFSPASTYLASAGRDNAARLWRISDGHKVAVMHHHDETNQSVETVEFSPDGTRLVTGSLDGTASIWAIPTGRLIHPLKVGGWVLGATFSPDGRYVATSALNTRDDSNFGVASLWNSSTGRLVFKRPTEKVANAVAFNPVGDFFAIASGDWGGLRGSEMRHGEITVWHVPSGRLIRRIDHTHTVWDLAFSPDGKKLVSSSADGRLRIWDTQHGKELSRIDLNFASRQVAFSPDGKFVVAPGEVHLYQPKDFIEEAQSRLTRKLTQREMDDYFLEESSRGKNSFKPHRR